jgi:hypothetical protein
MRIEGLKKYRGRNPRGYFEDLPSEVRRRAREWLHLLCKRWRGNLPRWRFAILVGQAKRLARTTPEDRSQWGRSMRAKKGGYAVQRRYKVEGRNPTTRATHMSRWIRKTRKRRQQEDQERLRHGLPEPSRHGFTQGCNPFWD